MRDITLEDTFYATFTTRAFATGIPTVLAGTPVLSIYENEGLTQITAGITLGVDHDTVVGLNHITVVATAANGYESGKDYSIVITTGTVDSVSVVGEVVGEFSIGRSAAAVDLANGTDGLGALKAETALIVADTNELQADDIPATLSTIAGYLDTEIAAILADTGTSIPALIATAQADLDIITGADGVNLLSATQTSIDAIEIDTSTTLDTALTDIKGATFSGATDSLEAIRNRGDSAWTGAPPTVATGTAQAGAANTITLAASDTAVDDLYNLLRVSITSGTGAGQSRAISDFVNSTKVATVINAWAVNPDATSGYEIVSDAITEITAAPTAAVIADAIWDEATTGHTTAGTFGEQCKNDIDAILADTGELQADWANGGRLDLLIDAILADTGELQTDWVNGGRLDLLLDAVLADTGELQTDWVDGGRLDLIIDQILADTAVIGAAGAGLTALATAANLATVDTVVDAIKVQTDKFVFTVANQVDANVQYINDAAVTGDGNATPWDGA